MEKLKHFSHEEHLLILQMKGESRDDEILAKSSLCHGCQTLIIPSEPFYSCENNCTAFFLHKTCAELPIHKFHHPMHPQHPLILIEKPPYEGGQCKCHCCGRQSWSNFTYHCETCNFDMDIFCATLEGRKYLEHPSHQHALMPVQKRVTFECHACGETKEDASFICSNNCSYWIHERCALLPDTKIREDHDHPLSLAYSLSDDYIIYKLSCGVCGQRLTPFHWSYHCSLCRYVVHLKCIETVNAYTGRIDHTAIQKGSLLLPTDDFAGDVIKTSHFQNDLMISLLRLFKDEISDLRYFAQRSLSALGSEVLGHSAIYFDVQESCSNARSGKEIKCEVCADVIVSMCYKLVANHSSYFVHVTCALLEQFLDYLGDEDPAWRRQEITLILGRPLYTWDFFKCQICNLDCNGYAFESFCPSKSFCDFRVDVKCALLPKRIYHEAHPHELFDWYREMGEINYRRDWRIRHACSGCGDFVSDFFFDCGSSCASYHLGYECALLPKTAMHRWDKHPLILSFPPFPDHPERFYCEVCEKEIHPLRWQYRCRECDQSFHPRCILEVTSSRNIKFGITVDVNEHSHTLTYVQEAGRFESACHTCQKSLYGNRAFECTPCKFYMCHDCVAKSKRAVNPSARRYRPIRQP